MLEKISEDQQQIIKGLPDSEVLSALAGLPERLDSATASNEACAERIETAAKSITEAAGQPTRCVHRHKHILDIKSNGVLYTLIGLVLWTLLSFYIIDRQCDTIACYRDNDLKYRHIKMKGGANGEDITELQQLFGWNRDDEAIKDMRKTVERYEQTVAEKAELEEQAYLKAKRARQLDEEAETLKNKR